MAKRNTRMVYIVEEMPCQGEVAYYGPFEESEEHIRLNDIFADSLESGGAEVYSTTLSPTEVKATYINPRSFWMDRLSEMINEDQYTNDHDTSYGRCLICGTILTKNGCENVSFRH